jgi:hypothetical protein
MNAESKVRVELPPQIEPGRDDDQYIRLTPQGKRLAAQLAKQTPRERERTMSQIIQRVRREQRAKVLTALRAAGDEGIPLQRLCKLLDVPLVHTVFIIGQIETEDRVVYIEFTNDDDEQGVPWAILSEFDGAESGR